MFMSLRSWFRRELIERGRLQIKPFGARYLGAIFSALLLRVLPNPQNFYLLGICWVCSCLPVPITGVLVLPLLFLAWTLKWTFLSPTSKQSKQRGTRGKRKNLSSVLWVRNHGDNRYWDLSWMCRSDPDSQPLKFPDLTSSPTQDFQHRAF